MLSPSAASSQPGGRRGERRRPRRAPQLSEQHQPGRDGDDERKRPEGPHPRVLQNDEDPRAVVRSAQRIGRVGQSVLVEGAREQDRGDQNAHRGDPRPERRHQRPDGRAGPSKDEADQR